LRWNSHSRGAVPPGVFIPVAEDAGLIVDIGNWVLCAALRQLRLWAEDGVECVPVAVNVSPAQLERVEFVDEVRKALRDSGVPPGLLKLEITESVFLKDAEAAVSMLVQLRELGVRISLDDFGTGYSNLGNLRRLPLDEIKIDRSFVNDLPHDVFSATLCRMIVAMSRQLEFGVVAEGVETEAQAAFLRDAGCACLQGFLFARPMPAAELHALLGQRTPRAAGRGLSTGA
jgi:EAL domain-containing protein (putative c-di-GMP-specific phosphodiesterase class I)